MKATYQMSEIPQSGVQVTVEGSMLRLLFDFTPAAQQEEEGGDDIYNCESVDVVGRSKGDVISAIMNDRYNADSVQAVMANYAEAQDETSAITPEKRSEYIAEYEAYQQYRHHAKEIATIVVSSI